MQAVVDYIRIHSHSTCYAVSMPAPVVQQVLSSMKIIMGIDNTNSGEILTLTFTGLLLVCRYFSYLILLWGLIVRAVQCLIAVLRQSCLFSPLCIHDVTIYLIILEVLANLRKVQNIYLGFFLLLHLLDSLD